MPSRGFFSWGKSRPQGEIPEAKVTNIHSREPREFLRPPPGVSYHGPSRSGPSPSNGHNGKSGSSFGRTSSQNDLNNPLEKRPHRNGSQFSSPLHNMPPYMHNIPPHLLPHFQHHAKAVGHNTRPHSVYWDQHNFPPHLLNDDRPGGRYIDTSLLGHKNQQRYNSTFDVSRNAPRSNDRMGQVHPLHNKPSKNLVSSSAVDVRYHSRYNLNDSAPVSAVDRKQENMNNSSSSHSGENDHNSSVSTLPTYWVGNEQINDSTSGGSKGKYSKNKNAKNKSKKSEKTKENKKKDKKSKKSEKSNLSHEKKAKLYKSHEELRSTYDHGIQMQTIEDMEKVMAMEKHRNRDGGLKLGKLEKAKTLERLDNIESMDDDEDD
ncbi:hypothetical protein FHG87_010395, partial [Trinorchestia longiramus]